MHIYFIVIVADLVECQTGDCGDFEHAIRIRGTPLQA